MISKIFHSVAALGVLCSAQCFAGYWEVSANGSYFKYNNGTQDNVASTTVNTRIGAGLAYRFLESTAIEFSFINSRTQDKFGQDISTLLDIYYIDRTTEIQNYSLDLLLYFTEKKSTFRPYIRGGGGYMIRKTNISGIAKDRNTGGLSTLSFVNPADTKSTSADGGFGFTMYVLDQIALEFSGTVYATDLDKPTVFLHYSVAGGIRVIF